MMKRSILMLSVCLFLVAGPLGPAPVHARSAGGEFGLGLSSLILTLPYGFVKATYAVVGSVTGGLAWAITGGRNEVARAIIQPALRGDYVIVPEHLLTERPLIFVGRNPDQSSSSEY